MTLRSRLAHWFDRRFPLPAGAPEPEPEAHRGVSAVALAEAGARGGAQIAWTLPERPPGVAPTMATDSASTQLAGYQANLFAWGIQQRFHEGLGFLGYPYLAELAQRPEYRMVVETIARDATRKWIKLTGPDEKKIGELEEALKKHDVQAKFRTISEKDGYFGRAQLYLDVGTQRATRAKLPRTGASIKGSLRNLQVIEPIWTYPGNYNADRPLSPDFYVPDFWYVMADQVDPSRLLTFVAREVPDMLKPTYSFGGLALSQMLKPYVDNWLRTRQSVSDLIHSFSSMVLSTNLSTLLQGTGPTGLAARLDLYNRTRDNRGVMAVDKDTETLECIATPLGSLDKLQAQAIEQIAFVAGIPLVVLLGVTPSGLNASSDGEIRTYYDKIAGYQEKFFAPHLHTVIEVIQLDLWGETDPDIGFMFLPLWEMSAKEESEIRKADAESDKIYYDIGAVSNEEIRERLREEEEGLYYGVDLSGDAPEPPAVTLANSDDGGDSAGDDPPGAG